MWAKATKAFTLLARWNPIAYLWVNLNFLFLIIKFGLLFFDIYQDIKYEEEIVREDIKGDTSFEFNENR